jgi:hypothetical protein
MYRLLRNPMGSFGLDFTLLARGNILDLGAFSLIITGGLDHHNARRLPASYLQH